MAARWYWCLVLLVVALAAAAGAGAEEGEWDPVIRMPGEEEPATARGGEPLDEEEDDGVGTRWAVLVAGSSGYGNYRHQADICHAYQILRKGGLKEENIVVFMYDDVANSALNPRRGVIINHPESEDVYAGVPKDYTGDQVTAKNFYAVLLGNKTAVTGGSRKVISSKPNDHIFIYYSDHGGPGVLGMPNLPYLYAGDFIKVLREKHASNNYAKMVKERTSGSNTYGAGSHVMEYGDKTFKGEKLYLYQGFNPANANITNGLLWQGQKAVVNQRDADILFLWKRYELLDEKSEEKLEVLREITGTVMHRKHLDSSVDFIGKLLFGIENGPSALGAVRSPGLPLVDDWDCLKRMVRIFESHCGSLTQYGMKHMRAFANICNSGAPVTAMKQASISACGNYNSARWSPMVQGYSA
nr:unnamed protein product [Digitaria exilis]